MSYPDRTVIWGGLVINQPLPGQESGIITSEIPRGDPSAVAQSGQRVQRDGQWRTTAYRNAITGGLSGVIYAPGEDEADQLARALRDAASVNLAPLTVYTTRGPRTLMVARDGELVLTSVRPGLISWSTTVIAIDPVWYLGGQTETGQVDESYLREYHAYLPRLSGGLSFPITMPVAFTESGESGEIGVALEGDARVTFVVRGPVLNPSIRVTNARGVHLLSWDFMLEAGEYLEIDPVRRQSLLQGQSSRPPQVRQWPELVSGDNSISFRASGYYDAARLTVSVQPLA